MYLLLLSLIYLAFISLGLPDSLLGSAWPTIYPAMHVDMSSMGLITMVISGCTILSSLLSERLVRRFGTKTLVVVSVLTTAVALFGFSTVTAFWMFLLWAIPYGLGAGAVDAALNNYVALHYNARHMSWLHCFWGVGTIISPSIMSYALTQDSWTLGYRIVAVLQLVIGLVLLLTLPIWNIHRDTAPQEEQSQPLGVSGALKIRGVLPMLLGFFCYCSAESTAMQWASSYLVEVRHIATEQAAGLAGLFYLGMTLGRLISGFLANRLGDKTLIRCGAVVALGGILFLVLPLGSNDWVFAGFVLIGVGCGPIYPSIIHATPTDFGAANSQAIIGIQMAFAYVGSTFMPPVFGLLAQYISMKLMPLYLALFLGGMLLLLLYSNTQVKKARNR